MIERDGPGAPWRFSDQPLPGSTAIAAAAVRDGGAVRAIVSVVPQLTYPPADDLPDPDPNVPPPILPPFGLPGDGYLLRETASGWEDEQRTAFAGSGDDRPLKSDPVLSLLLDPSGNGWAVGGWSGDADAAGRGSSARNGGGRAIRERVRTAAVFRYGGGAAVPPAAGSQAGADAGRPDPPRGRRPRRVRGPCADLAPQSIGPDRTLAAALADGRRDARRRRPARPALHRQPGRRAGSAPPTRAATRNCSAPSRACRSSRRSAPTTLERRAIDRLPQRLRRLPGAVRLRRRAGRRLHRGHPRRATGSGARTHYAFDSDGPGGTVRVIVIDNSLGSLAASDPHQNPAEAQLPWLEAVLADARAKGIPAIVMGNRSLNTNFTPKLNVADGRRRGGAGAGRRRRLRLPLRPPRGEPRDADPRRRRDDDPQLRRRHARLSLADRRRDRAETSRTRCSATAASCCSRSTPPAATRRPTAPRSASG